MNISLTPVLENYVKAKVESGLYNSASEVIRESLRALQEKEIDSKIQTGLEQAKAGLTVPFNEQFAEDLITELNERIESRKSEKMHEFTVEITLKARLELLETAEYIAIDNPERAESFVRELVSNFTKILSTFPNQEKSMREK